MPRIDAPTVAEHRARRHAALLKAARDLAAETGEAPSLAAVGERTGLARSSVYEYFGSRQELLEALVIDVFSGWADQVRTTVGAGTGPLERLLAYVEVNLELFSGPDQALARTLTAVVDPTVLREPMQEFHRALQDPLLAALRDLGEPDPETAADIVDSAILRASRATGDSHDATAPDAARGLLRRILVPYAQQLRAGSEPG